VKFRLPIGGLFTVSSFLKITELAQLRLIRFSTDKVMYYFRQNMGWATYWATSSQTHLVTLLLNNALGFELNGSKLHKTKSFLAEK
jgi:hypothetical protein